MLVEMPDDTPSASDNERTPLPEHVGGCDLLIDGGVLITLDDRRAVIEDGAVAIAGDRIVEVGERRDLDHLRSSAVKVLDCAGKVVIPGLTDGHTHLFQTLGRGLGDGMSLVPWLRHFMFPYACAITRDMAVAAVRLGAARAAIGAQR